MSENTGGGHGAPTPLQQDRARRRFGTRAGRERRLGTVPIAWPVPGLANAFPTPSARGVIVGDWPQDALGRAALRLASFWWRGTSFVVRVSREVMPQLTATPVRFDADAWIARRIDAFGWPGRSLRVGMVDPGAWGATLMNAPGLFRVEWVELPGAGWIPAARRQLLDAVVRKDASGAMVLWSVEGGGRDAAWYDWGAGRPISFASVFPGRVDCARVTLPESASEALEAGHGGDFIRALVESAAVLSRSPARLGLRERLDGRVPIALESNAGDLVLASREASRAVMLRLGALLNDQAESWGATPAGRAVSAYAAGTDDELLPTERLSLLSSAERVAPGELEVLLRRCAGLVSVGDYAAALPRLSHAAHQLRSHPMRSTSDQPAFVQAELETGRGTAMSLGRVAAGICLAAAQLGQKHLAYFRDDFLDDLLACPWRKERDGFVALVHDLFRELGVASDDAPRSKAA